MAVCGAYVTEGLVIYICMLFHINEIRSVFILEYNLSQVQSLQSKTNYRLLHIARRTGW